MSPSLSFLLLPPAPCFPPQFPPHTLKTPSTPPPSPSSFFYHHPPLLSTNFLISGVFFTKGKRGLKVEPQKKKLKEEG